MKRFLNWLADKISPRKTSPKITRNRPGVRRPVPRATAATQARRSQPSPTSDYVEFDASIDGKIDDAGPGKNVWRRNKYVREDTGTHDTLCILGEAPITESNDQDGIDPYNTGRFDRSKNWDKRFRKD